MATRLRLATRGSPLARWQAARVAAILGALPGGPVCEVLVVSTRGDRLTDVPVEQIGGQGAFVTDIQAAVLEGRAEIAVHSAKDLPSTTPEGLLLACVPERADPRDALVGSRLADLPAGATVATGSVRRRAQLAWLRPDLTFSELRGNMATRLDRAAEAGAGVVAVAALDRLGLTGEIAEILETGTVLPQVAQGALAVECRAGDLGVRELLAAIDDGPAHRAVRAERAFLGALGSGCSLPVGALATPSGFGATGDGGTGKGGTGEGGTGDGGTGDGGTGDGGTGDGGTGDGGTGEGGTGEAGLVLEGLLASRDGRVLLRRRACGSDPVELGQRLAGELLDNGGRALDDWAGLTESGR